MPVDFRTIKLKPIAAGLAIDLFASVLVGILIAVVIVVVLIARGQMSPEAVTDFRAGLPVRLAGLIGTTLSTVLGGYVAARMSRPDGLINSIALGLLCIVLSVIVAAAMPGVTPVWKLVAGILLTVPAAALGGWLGNRPRGRVPPPLS